MRNTLKVLILAGAVTGLISLHAAARGNHHFGGHNLSIGSYHDDEDDDTAVTECSQLNIRFDDEAGVRAEEELPAANLRSLKLNTLHHGGVRVVGWDRPTYSVKACKAAALGADLAQIRTTLNGNELQTAGPDASERWVVVYLIRTPRNATLDLHSRNGEISLHQVVGTVTARAQNGPISLRDSSGTIDAETENGPISLTGGSGNLKLSAENGPISVKLAGTSWLGGHLDAATHNGPLSVKLPRNYASGVVVESDGNGPVSCLAEGCRVQVVASAKNNDQDDDDDDEAYGPDTRPRRFELGHGPQVVHLSTNNGPLSVKDTM
jgi:hypothetical protein